MYGWGRKRIMINKPSEYFEYIKTIYDDVTYKNYLNLLNQDNYRCIRINTLKLNNINNITSKLQPYQYTNAFYIDKDSHLGKSIFHELGAYYIQEPSAMIPVIVLNPKQNDKVLDLCAAPGSKSTQIAQQMQNVGLLVSNEIDRKRAQVLNENINRLGIKNTVITNMHPKNMENIFIEYFDAILVDAPCSGEGMFRKYPETILDWSLKNVKACANRQKEILKSAIKMLKPGGKIVYSTCTLNNIENEFVAYDILENKNLIPNNFSIGNDYYSTDGMLKLNPINFKGEGQFIFSFTKLDSNIISKGKPGLDKTYKINDISDSDRTYFNNFIKERNINGFYCDFKYNNILMQLPDIDINMLSQLNIINAGLRLGEIKYNAFFPEFAFARAINGNTLCLNLSQDETLKYIIGESLINHYNFPNGFALLKFNDYSVSWGKINNGIIKNHYPKFLRKQLYN